MQIIEHLRIVLFLFGFLQCTELFAFNLDLEMYNIENGVIYPKIIAPLIVNQCSRGNFPGHYWTPKKNQIIDMDEKLLTYIKNKNIDLRGEYKGYLKQFTGVVVNGNKAIYVNAFTKKHWLKTKAYMQRYNSASSELKRKLFLKYLPNDSIPKNLINWRWTPVNTCHGGKSFFGVIYFVKDKIFKYFSFNL